MLIAGLPPTALTGGGRWKQRRTGEATHLPFRAGYNWSRTAFAGISIFPSESIQSKITRLAKCRARLVLFCAVCADEPQKIQKRFILVAELFEINFLFARQIQKLCAILCNFI